MPLSFSQRRLSWAISLVLLLLGSSAVPAQTAGTASTHRGAPHLFPDYVGVSIPPNIAPLNFRVEEPGTHYRVEIRSRQGKPILLAGRSPSLEIPRKAWQELLRANSGQPLYLDVSVQEAQSGWSRFETITNFIAREPIDNHLVYRLLKPLYNVYVNVGIYQRDLESFEQRPVLENSNIEGSCLNCHTFLNRRADTFALNIRTTTNHLHPMLLVRSNAVTRIDKTMG
ncbi:MAG TPA: hypothetical protein VNZ22_17895, partial [Bacillota bacterium]|nr:hypothetical protein [Bacillota bacterium]